MISPRNERHEVSRMVPLSWIVILSIAIGFMFGAIFHPFTGNSSGAMQFTAPEPDPVFAELAKAQLVQITPTYVNPPTATTVPEATNTPMPTATSYPWCDQSKSGELCSHPGIVIVPTLVPYCNLVTPSAIGTYTCRKIDAAGTAREDWIE